MSVALEKGAPIDSPISIALYPTLATVLLVAGVCFTAAYFLYQVSTTRYTRKVPQEALLGGLASVFLGLGR